MEVLATLFPHNVDTTIPTIIMLICMLVARRARNRVLCITACVCLFLSSMLWAGRYIGLLISLLCAAAITAMFLIPRLSEDDPPETLQERAFRKAVSQSKEDAAIKLGKKLLQKGDEISVRRAMMGFKSLAEEGFPRGRELYASAACQYSQLQQRRDEKEDFPWGGSSEVLFHLEHVIRLYKVRNATVEAALLRQLRAEQLHWYAVTQDAPFLSEERIRQYRENAAKILDELAADAADDPYVRDAIAYAKKKGIKPLPVSKPSAPDNPPKKPAAPSEPPRKPAVPQTLKTCLRCGAALSGKKCTICNLDHTKGPIYLLVKVDSRDLQMSK